jgi:hypothetical protein
MTGNIDIYETVCKFFMKSRNIHISGTILQALEKELIKMLGKNKQNIIGFQVLTVVTMNSTMFGDVFPHSIAEMTVYFYQATWAHIPNDSTLQAKHL